MATGKAGLRDAVRGAIRGLWAGQLNENDFMDAMQSAINRSFTQAWQEGLAVHGLTLKDMTTQEKARLSSFIAEQLTFVPKLAHDVREHSKANGGKLANVIGRADMWANKYDLVKQTAEAMAGTDLKREWRLGATERHCRTCKGLHGRTYRQSVWLANIIPPSPLSTCRGYRCLCQLIPTDKPITKGRFPAGLLNK